MSAPFHLLPSIHELVQTIVAEGVPRTLALEAARKEVDLARQALKRGETSTDDLFERSLHRAQALQSRALVPVINGTGVILHTNLGRAPLAQEAIDAVVSASGYSNLELNLSNGERGGRLDGIRSHLCTLCGVESAIAVNNCAAAVLLTLTALAKGRSVLVSRGELVEIGGSFRVPDVISAGGAHLVEVGTTNRTRVSDFEAAITEETAMILRVHPSNFKISGFTERPKRKGLVDLGRRSGLPVVEDLGSGLLESLGPGFGPTVREVMDTGVDLACFSGDKLLGGPQAGIIVGRTDLVSRIRKHPMYRAMRLDKLALAALEATLSMIREGRGGSVPVRQMLLAPVDVCLRRAVQIAEAIDGAIIEDSEGMTGGGALPGKTLKSPVVVIRRPGLSALARQLREGDPAVLLRVSKDALVIDPRTLLDGQEPALINAVNAAVAAMDVRR